MIGVWEYINEKERLTMKVYSQRNEQDIILEYLSVKNIESGKLLDIGAFDGETYSNTRAIMLKYPKWKGVFVEPSAYSFYKLFKLYQEEPSRAELVNMIVSEENEMNDSSFVEFYDTPTHSAASSIQISNVHRFISKVDNNGLSIDPRKIFVGKIGMRELLKTFSDDSNYDFINVDVEGNSAKMVLQEWFNPLDYGCKIICIEHDNQLQPLCDKFNGLGYATIGYNGENLIFALL
jgi:FkbM family methyltransferase